MNICALIATRKASNRIKNKSIKKFSGSNLTIIKINQALNVKKFKNIYFSSDITGLNNYAQKKGLILIKRQKKHLGKSTISDFSAFLAKNVKENHICYLTNTSPLLKVSTIEKAIKTYKKLDFSEFDSLNTFELVKDFLWNEIEPINYKLGKQPMSQNLSGIFKFNPAISIISKKLIIKYNNVIGKKPYKIFIKKPESFDIDTMYDFKLAEMYYKNRNTNRLL